MALKYGAPGEITSGSCPPPFGFATLIRNSLPANLSNSYRSNSPVVNVYHGPKWGLLKNGAPGEIRTPDRPVRSRVLYPAELRAHFFNYKFSGGERGIRTLEGLLTLTPLAGERFRPLSHLSIEWSPPPTDRGRT